MPESQNIEWKKTWRDEYIKWICGFANAQGGILVIGKDDKGIITGIDNSKKLLEDIPNKVKDLLGIIVDVDLKSENNKEYIEIKVEPHSYPISYKGQYHYRSGNTKQELKGSALSQFLLKKQGKSWDGVPVPNIGSSDLENSAFERLIELGKKSGRINKGGFENKDLLLNNLNLKDGKFLKRAAILLFHKDPEKYVTGSFIKIGFFRTDGDLLYQDLIQGNLFEQADKSMDLLLTKYLKAYISYEGLSRIEKYPFPEPALREALLNAIVHKDYSKNVPIQISVYEDKIMFWNPGILPEGWTVETLKEKHSSRPFNPNIANAFFRSGMIESWGRGISRIIESCKEEDVPMPKFKYETNGLWLVFESKENDVQDKNIKKTIQKTTRKTARKISVKQKEILNILKANPSFSRLDIVEHISGISESGVKYNLKRLQEKGLLKRVGSAKGGHWEVIDKND